MRRSVLLITVIFITTLVAMGKKDDSLEQLKARFSDASGDQQISLGLEIAERQLKSADKLYSDGNTEQARSAVQEVVQYSEKAGEAATQSGKKLKQAEISVRKMAHKLLEIKRSVNFEDQQPLQDAADRLEHVRSELLTRMFGPSRK
jgi:hypothetical protein